MRGMIVDGKAEIGTAFIPRQEDWVYAFKRA